MKRAFDITIANQKFTIRTDDDEKHVKKVADYVNKKMHEITTGNKAISTTSVAILAALNIADDYYKTKRSFESKASGWLEKMKKIVAQL